MIEIFALQEALEICTPTLFSILIRFIFSFRKVKQVPWWEGLKKKERQKRNVETMGFDPELENEAWSRWIDLEDHEDPLVDLIDFTGTANAPPSHSSLCLCLCHSMRQASSSFQLRRRHHIIRSYSTILCQWRS